MAIPNFQGFMLPFLRALADGKDYHVQAVVMKVADAVGLTSEERAIPLPAGSQPVAYNRIHWAKLYLKRAGLIEQPARAVVRITAAGRALLATNPDRIDSQLLKKYPSFLSFYRGASRNGEATADDEPTVTGVDDPHTPEENLEAAFGFLRSTLAEELIDRLKASSPAFFEQAVVRLLVAMGYGGSLADAGQVVGKPGDGGIDGLIKEDKLGLDAIYVQAKRWQDPVGRPPVQAFAGAMGGERARKGVFITTSTFTKDAREYVRRIDQRIVLVDGEQLAELLIEHNVGVTTARTYAIKKVDLDFFAEDGGG